MSLVSSLLASVNAVRVVVDTSLGLRNHRVIVRTDTWSGGSTGKGVKTSSDVEILPRPKVKDLGSRGYQVSRISPNFTVGGFPVTSLVPTQPNGTATYLVLIGPDGFTWQARIADAWVQRSLEYVLIAEDRR